VKTFDFGEIMRNNDCWFDDYDTTCPFCDGNEVLRWDGLDDEQQLRVIRAMVKDQCKKQFGELTKNERAGVKKALLGARGGAKGGAGLDKLAEYYVTHSDEFEFTLTDKNVGGMSWDDAMSRLTDDDPNHDEGTVEEWYGENVEQFDFRCDCSEGHFEVMWNTGYEVDPHMGFEAARKMAWKLGFLLIEHEDEHYLLSGGCGYDFTWQLHYCRFKLQGNFLPRETIDDLLSTWGGHVFLRGAEKRELLEYIRSCIGSPLDALRSNLQRWLDLHRVTTPRDCHCQEVPAEEQQEFQVSVVRLRRENVTVRAATEEEAMVKASKMFDNWSDDLDKVGFPENAEPTGDRHA
jgi:hypothetical protein